MNNAEKVIEGFGGLTKMSKLTGISITTLFYWKAPKPKGCGGRVPDKHKRALTMLAFDLGLDLNKEIGE